MLQQTLGPPEGLRPRKCPAQVVHQPVETGVVRRLLEVFRTLVQPGAQDGGQGTVETAGKGKEILSVKYCPCGTDEDERVRMCLTF